MCRSHHENLPVRLLSGWEGGFLLLKGKMLAVQCCNGFACNASLCCWRAFKVSALSNLPAIVDFWLSVSAAQQTMSWLLFNHQEVGINPIKYTIISVTLYAIAELCGNCTMGHLHRFPY